MSNTDPRSSRRYPPQFACLLAAGAACVIPLPAFAGRPLVIDDADPVERGGIEIEAGVQRVDEGRGEGSHWHTPVGVTLGFGVVEVGLGFGGWLEDEGDHYPCGWEDFSAGLKWRFFNGEGMWPRLAVVPSIAFPANLGQMDHPSYDGTLIASWSLGEAAGLHANAGYGWANGIDGEDDSVPFHFGVAVDAGLTDTLVWVGEVFAEKETNGGGDVVWEMNTGLRWEDAKNVVFDIAVGAGLSSDAPDWTATLGVTWLLGAE